ncbi:MAG TPA: phage holin family protein [Rhodocyclaceae bacterium]|nr:phage holin family protein [Rhodocyclaceae bacterium]
MSAASHPGLLASLRQFLAHGVELAQTRLELILLELEEEKNRVFKLLVCTVAALMLLGAGLVFLAVFITVLLWEEHRLLALGLCSTFFLGGGLAAAGGVLFIARQRPRHPHEASMDELSQDRASILPPQS